MSNARTRSDSGRPSKKAIEDVRADILARLEDKLTDPDPALLSQLTDLLGHDASIPEETFPSGPTGDLSGSNGLFRANWFNGRFLDADTLKRQERYWDLRLLTEAQVHPTGVSWGLGFQLGDHDWPMPTGEEAVGHGDVKNNRVITCGHSITLQPGVAFDGLGRPAIVDQPFKFTIDDLIPRYREKPQVAVPGGTTFSGCICLQEIEKAGELGPSLSAGPYLIVIEPSEAPEGEARVYGEVCTEAKLAYCQTSGFRGGFSLKLINFPVDVPESKDVRSAWDLRGILSAYYFDVFEHSLIKRWDPFFARDDHFCAATGPYRRRPGAVPLAMVYIGPNQNVAFFDRWIPRRTLVATAAASWSAKLLGAPTPAAAFARLHQFQCQLTESLTASPLLGNPSVGNRQLNLYERGFRHIPPVGFLPIEPGIYKNDWIKDFGSQNVTTASLFAGTGGGIGALLCTIARRQAEIYFDRTNVFPYFVVALHDDDVLEDFNNAFEKDPVVVARRPDLSEAGKEAAGLAVKALADAAFVTPGLKSDPLAVIFAMLIEALRWITLDDLVNREIELVKVIIPLQGLRRDHPIVGRTSADARSLVELWTRIGAGLDSRTGQLTGLLDAGLRGGPHAERYRHLIPGSLPRHFVVYVKQRMVLLDVMYNLLDAWSRHAAYLETITPTKKATHTEQPALSRVPLAEMKRLVELLPDEVRATLAVLLQINVVRNALIEEIISTSDDLRVQGRWDAVFGEIDRIAETESRSSAVHKVLDSFADEYPDFETVKMLVALQSPDSAEASLRVIANRAAERPLLDTRGQPKSESLARDLLHGEKIRIFDEPNAREMWAEGRAALGRRPVNVLVPGLQSTAPLDEILRRTPQETAEMLGGEANLDRLKPVVIQAANELAAAAGTLGAKGAPPDVIDSFRKLLTTHDAKQAYHQVADIFSGDPEKANLLAQLKPLADKLGADGFARVADAFFRSPIA